LKARQKTRPLHLPSVLNHEQTGPAIAAACGIERESALAVIDLSLFPGQKLQAVELIGLALAYAAAENRAAFLL
jgi:hypothetical protein